jgi:hypothetical protein
MEANVITQPNDKSIRMGSDRFLEDWNELYFEQVPNQRPLPIQKLMFLHN